jgi:hypothetical protein
MANAVASQIIIDGARNAVVKTDLLLDTSDLAATDVVDPAALSSLGPINGACSRVNVYRILYDIEDTLTVNLFWDATADVIMWRLTGRGEIDLRKSGGLPNNAGAGITGKIQMTTQGWSASAILAATFTLEMVKS